MNEVINFKICFRGGWQKRKTSKNIPLDIFGDILVSSDGFYRLIVKSVHKFGDPCPKNVLTFESVHFPGIEDVSILKINGPVKLAKFFQLKNIGQNVSSFKLKKLSLQSS
jgi:hypothetical protein